VKILANNLTLLDWLPESQEVYVYIVYYRIPSEDGFCFVERTVDRELKLRYKVIPSKIRNRIKALRFRFYNILKEHGTVKTEIGRIVKAEDLGALKAKLYSWLKEWKHVEQLINDFINNPVNFNDWPAIRKTIHELGIPWNELVSKLKNIPLKLRIEFIGPLKLPRSLYEELLEKAT